MAVYYILPIFARVTTKTNYMKFRKLRIIQAGVTTNFGTYEGKEFPLVITETAVQSVVTLGNLKPIHCRRTHNGTDMLDGYLGKFVNFVYEDGVAYADLELSEALQAAYPSEAKFISEMIKNEPDMLGVSVVGINNQTLNGDVLDVTEFFELYSCDLVGLPAATTSLFNNQNEKKMNKFFSSFASLFRKSSFATETVETVDGASITIEAAGETMAIGDKVFDSEGNVHPDGKVEVAVEDGVLVITIANGVIENVEAKVEDRETEIETPVTADVPEEFANRIAALEASVTELTASLEAMTAQFSRATAKPGAPAVNMPKKKETKLSKEAVAEAAKRFYNK
nr:MAG: Prohead core protein serine protease [Bacteriophage sp.]